jgi:hypothetical protein
MIVIMKNTDVWNVIPHSLEKYASFIFMVELGDKYRKEKTEALIDTSKEAGLEVNREK